jgi:hypothetical protein
VALALGPATPFLPRFKLRPTGAGTASINETELANAIKHYADVSFIGDDQARERAVTRFEMTAARVRPPLDAWRRLELATRLLGVERGTRVIAQLPFDPAAPWVGGEFADQDHRHKAGRLSILLQREAVPDASDAWSGLFLDQWVEQIPLDREQTGVAFHYDDPGAEAPQTILLAVPPVRTENWDAATLLSILTETLELSKVRAVDGELLGALGQALPAIYLADSADPVTIATDFATSLRQEARVGRATKSTA